MFDSLTERLESAFQNIKGHGKLTEVNIAKSIKEIRRALVAADVNYKIAKEFTDKIKEQALGQENVLNSVKPGELMVKIVQDELTELMGGETSGLQLDGSPSVILIAGLQGSGKTTFSGKLALHLKEQKKSPLLVAGDVYRPAAIDQLSVIGDQIKVPVYKEPGNKDPEEIALKAIEHADTHNHDVVIVDTAGRLAIDERMMEEISGLKEALMPSETLFVVDAMTGQDAVQTAKTFNERIDYSGVVLTKLDGDTRGGAALSIKYTVGKPIKFVSRGEKLRNTLDVFHPDRMAQRILGMGDITSFVEKAQKQYDEKEAEKLERKIKKQTFDFNDFLSQMNQIRRMGDLKSLMGMIPGMNKMTKNLDIDDSAFNRVESIIHSMTPEERTDPKLINRSRKRRIAKGCGRSVHEINRFIKQFKQMRKMMKMMSSGKGQQKMQQMMSRLGKR